jgi:hypothetical protein
MRKQQLWIGIYPRFCTEIVPPSGGLPYRHSERQHRWRHPDVDIRVIARDTTKTAGRFDEIQQAIMLALQASGYSVQVLRYVAPEPKTKTRKPGTAPDGSKQLSMFEEGE